MNVQTGGIMQVFVDTAEVEDVRKAKLIGLADGVTTNPTLIRKSGRDFKKTIIEIANLIEGPVFAETVSEEADGIVKEGRDMTKWAQNVVVKIPINRAGLEAARILETEGIRTALTLVFSAGQALLAAKAGASFICPFVGRLDDIGLNGLELIREIMDIFRNYDLETEVIVASLRTPNHVLECALIGADGVTIPFKIIEQLEKHPLTDSGIKTFLEDWKKVK
jgi:transaldolase